MSWKISVCWSSHLLLMSEPSTMRESSMSATISVISLPLRRSSPLALNWLKVKTWTLHSLITCFSFASMSRSFTALMQMSWRWKHITPNVRKLDERIPIFGDFCIWILFSWFNLVLSFTASVVIYLTESNKLAANHICLTTKKSGKTFVVFLR